MGAKEYRRVVETLESLGMRPRQNKRGLIFTGPDGWVIPVAQMIDDFNAKQVIHNAQKHYGAATRRRCETAKSANGNGSRKHAIGARPNLTHTSQLRKNVWRA